MEIIVHGKPYSDSSRQSGGLDESFFSSFTSTFFRESGLLKELNSEEALIVDARNWKGRWYGIYTYALQVVDFANSPGVYFAISVVFPDEYNCFTREVYARLRKVSREYVVGRYLSQQGKYLVKDFSDTQMFEGLVAFVRNNWNAIVESFDSRFVAQNEFRNDVKYNIDDCDSKAYLDAWRMHGRIIITPNTPSKETLIGNMDKDTFTIRKLQQTINELTQQLADARQKEQEHVTTSSKQRQEALHLKDDNERLRNENKRLNDSSQDFYVWADKLGKEAKNFVEKHSRRMAGKFPVPDGDVPRGTGKPSETSPKNKSRNWMQWVVVIVLALSTVSNILVLRDISNIKNTGNSLVEPSDITPVKDSTITDTIKKSISAEAENINTSQVKYRINILEYSGKGSLTVGKVYTLVLEQRKEGENRWSNCDITPQWLINRSPSSSNKLTSNKQENVEISCIVDGMEIIRPDNPLKFVNPSVNKPPRQKENKKDDGKKTTDKKVAGGTDEPKPAISTQTKEQNKE